MFQPGHIFAGRYRIVSLLGRGAMGEVYRADDLRLEQAVALKLLATPAGYGDHATERFVREVRLARAVAHPNVCRVYDIGDADGRHYLSMEYVDGETLASLLRRIGRLPREKALDIARQLCAGIAAAHDQRVLHRDLKPANIMVDGRGQIRIMDFGIAVPSDETSTRESAGTPGYMAPEQLTGARLSERTDVYAIGLVLYELFAGHPFHSGGSLLGDDRRPPFPELDADVAAVVARCLESDPAKRPPSALAIAKALPQSREPSLTESGGVFGDAITHVIPTGALHPAAAWIMLAAALAGTLAIASRASIATVTPSDLPKPPEVLAARSAEILGKAASGVVQRDREFWFLLDASVSGGRPPIRFAYRESPRDLIPRNLFHLVTEDDPPLDVAGMANVVLDPGGRLVRFSRIADSAARGRATGAIDWQAWFADAGLNEADFVAVDSKQTLPVPHDRALLWERRSAEPVLQVAAATLDGAPVFFEVTDSVSARATPRNMLASGRPAFSEAVLWAFIVAAFAAAAALARRNLRRGEGDRASARKMCIFVACCGVLFAMFRAHHVPSEIDELTFLLGVSGWVLVWTAFCWLTYLAIEPPMRRLWPVTLISLTRLLDGRVRDPLVGRDVLVGLLAGIVFVAVLFLRFQFFHRAPEILLAPALESVKSARHVAAALALQTSDVWQFMLGGMLFLVLLYSIVGSRWIAALLWVVLVTPVSTGAPLAGGDSLGWDLLFGVVLGLFGLMIMIRFGILAAVVMLIYERLFTRLPITLDLSAWYFESSLAVLSLVFALAVYGFIVALGDRAAFGGTRYL